MPLVALGVTALLTGLDWGAWDWASNTGHSTVGLIAGVLMVPAAVAFAGFLLLTLIAVARKLAARAAERRHRQATSSTQEVSTSMAPRTEVSSPVPASTPGGRIAA
jgi:TRAP-type C4-dicarboxylate transport system permease small subunit